ncbi:MAG: immune inhibitor A [Hymenobacteraceae bacterium]|nr:immune inhibitor A [Hymenobacteraceae bacterium]
MSLTTGPSISVFRQFRWFLSLLLLSLLMAAPTDAQPMAPGAYSRVRVWLGPQGLAELARLGIAVDHGESKQGIWFASDFSAAELATMRAAGRRCEVLIADVQTHYRTQNARLPPTVRVQAGLQCAPRVAYPVPNTFRLGSMGGFFTYEEILQKLDSMRLRWPNLISVKQPTGPLRTVEGRPIYWVKISDNPGLNEPEPEILYSGVHHAREPMSVAQMLYYMYYLLEKYATDADVRAIVNNTELYFLPCVNPDGYIYNQTTDPEGGGMWRKNRRPNPDGTFGIDLNRNYGSNWGYDDLGSSPNGFSDVYRGPSAFSEPETRAVRDFSFQHAFQVVLNYHSYGNVFIYPFGYERNIYTPDSAQFADYGRWLTRDDRYTFGTCNQVLNYVTNGDANDWQYSTLRGSKPQAFSFTPEVGQASEGFWPPADRIQPLCHENLTRNLDAARLLLADAVLTDFAPRFFRRRAGFARYSLKQLGLKTPGSYTVTLTPLTGAGVAGPAKSYRLNSVRAERIDSIALTLPATLSAGQTFRYVLSVNNGLFTRRDTIAKIFGTPTVAFVSNNTSLTGWTSPTGWDVDNTIFHSPPGSLTDSPGGPYANGQVTDLTTAQRIDLRGTTHAELTFWARWEIETRFDYGQVLVSSDNGASWQPLCGRYSRPGNGHQLPGEPIYDGYQLDWVRESISLDDFVGRQVLVRFRLGADSQREFDGFYVDDVRVEKAGTLTGLPEVVVSVGLSVYPSPGQDLVTIAAAALPTSGATLTVRDALGRVIMTQPFSQAPTRLNVRAWPAGVYFVTVQAIGRQVATARFMVGGQ